MAIRATHLTYITSLALICVLMAGCGHVSREVTNTDREIPTLEQTASELRNPEQIHQWLCQNITFRAVQGDFRTPEEIYRDGFGDCTDFARLGKYFMEYQNIPCNMVSIWGRDYGHTVIVYQDGTRWLDYGNFSSCESIESLAKYLCPDYTKLEII